MCIKLLYRFKIWHYTGSLIYQRPWNNQEELWEVAWQSFPSNVFPQKPISYKAVEGIVTNDNQSQGNNHIMMILEYVSKHIFKINIVINIAICVYISSTKRSIQTTMCQRTKYYI